MEKPLEPFPVNIDQPDKANPLQPDYSKDRDNHDWPIKSKASKIPILVVAGVLGGLLLVSFAVIVLLLVNASRPSPKTATTIENTQKQNPQPTPITSNSSLTAPYTSNGKALNLNFSYPSDWTVAPSTGTNKSDQPIIVTSPIVSILNSSGRTTPGKIIVTIRPVNSTLIEISNNKTLAAIDSIQIGYTKPTESQRQYPYLSFIRLSGGADETDSFDEVIITGATKFTKGQLVAGESLSQLDPIVTARFYACTSESCTGPGAATLTITQNTWQNATIFTQTQTLFESLEIR